MGTPELASVSLSVLLRQPQFKVVAVATQPDRPKGRDLKLHCSPVKEIAVEQGIPVLQPQRAREEGFIESLRTFAPELIVVAAFGQILPQAILDLPRYGCINVHTSLLPKYRGAAPIQWAIIQGESETGVTIMKMDAGMDTGAILAQRRSPITASDDAQTLHDRLAEMGAELLLETIPEYVAGKVQPRPQPAERVSYAPKIKKSDGLIDWSQPAVSIWNRVRGLVPWPGAFTYLPPIATVSAMRRSVLPFVEGQLQSHLLKIWKAGVADGIGNPGTVLCADKTGIVIGCGSGALRIIELQREGGKRLSAHQFLSYRLAVGWVLGGKPDASGQSEDEAK